MVLTMRRSFTAAIAALCLIASGQLFALGLGDIDVESSLNEKFVGQIELSDSGDLQASEIIVSMASAEDFERIGVERFFYLTNLSFDVVTSGNGAVVNVSSSQPIAEPYLNFIVEVHWPSGRLLKEFTVLLDPPTFSQAAAPAVSAPQQSESGATAGRIQRTEPAATSSNAGTQVTLAPRPATSAPPPRPSAANAPSDGTVRTTRDDTLWKIAERTLPDEQITINQQMIGIQRLNRRAFIKDNINLLKAGYVLRLPTEEEVLELSPDEAKAAVREQVESWRDGSFTPAPVADASQATPLLDADGDQLRSQVDATASEPSQSTNEEAAQGEVRIVANSGADAAAGSGTETDESVTQLIEEKDTLNRQVDELTYQLDREKELAASQVELKDRQLEVQNEAIAALQEQLESTKAALAAQEQNQNQNPTPPPPVQWWASPMVLGGVIGVLVLVLIGLLVAMRRNRGMDGDALDADDDEYDDDFDEQAVAEEDSQDDDADDDLDDDLALDEDDDEDETDIAARVTPIIGHDELELDSETDDDDDELSNESEATAGVSQTGDVIGEADIYIAYGRYGQAANLLLNTLANEPERYDVRLKLLEVYVETSDHDNFATHGEYIVDNCDDEDVLHACRELETRLGENQLELDGAADGDTSEENVQGSGDTAQDETELNLDQLDDVATVVGDETEVSEDEFQLEFDEEDLDDADTASATRGELGGDLGMDFDPEDEKNSSDDSAEVDLSDQAPESELADEMIGDAIDDVVDADSTDDFEIDDLDIEDMEIDGLDDESAQSADGSGDDFEFADDDGDVNSTKLDLAEAYLDMGDDDGARDILNEVVEEGSPDQQQKAQGMLSKIA